MPTSIFLAIQPDEVARCYPVMAELRPHLRDAGEFAVQVERQRHEGGYELAALEDGGEVRAVAGFRVLENLASGRLLYVDDLVTHERDRSLGYGARLLAWLEERARADGCRTIQLHSGTQRLRAHRFYFAQGMTIGSFKFSRDLN